jgi:hypothetical protein
MNAHKIGRTLKIHAYCPTGHASIFLTVMQVEQLRVKFAVASVLGISAQGIINQSQPAKNLQQAHNWAVDFVRKKLGDRIAFTTTAVKKGLQ